MMENDRDTPECPVCDGDSIPYGRLGRLDWWECRDCGMQHSTPALHEPEYVPTPPRRCRKAPR